MKISKDLEILLRRPDLEILVEAEAGARSFRTFVDLVWHVVEPSTPFVPGFHIDAIIEHLEAITRGEIRNLIINVPPRHMKSLLVSVFWPAWEWIQFPQRRWLFASYGLTLSQRDSVKCRRLIDSAFYQERWGDRYALTTDQNTKTRFDNNRSGYRIATSVGGAATGEGGDRIVCDDPHNVQEAESDSVRKGTIDWWNVVMSTRQNDPKTSARVVVMQRCHELDLSGHLRDQGGYEHLILPAEYEGSSKVTSIGWSDPRTENGQLLWPERFGPDELASLKRSLGSYAAAGQLQQRPSPAEGGMIKRYWFRFWQLPGMNLPPVPVRMPDGSDRLVPAVEIAHLDEQIQSWDCAFKGHQDADFVVGQVWGVRGAAFILLDQDRRQMDFPATLEAVRNLSRKWPESVLKLIEDKANGSAVIQSLEFEIPGIVAVNPEGGKVARASAVSPLIEAGNVYLPHPDWQPWVNAFIEECAAFPNGAHDDQVDAMSQALLRYRQPEEYFVVEEHEYRHRF